MKDLHELFTFNSDLLFKNSNVIRSSSTIEYLNNYSFNEKNNSNFYTNINSYPYIDSQKVKLKENLESIMNDYFKNFTSSGYYFFLKASFKYLKIKENFKIKYDLKESYGENHDDKLFENPDDLFLDILEKNNLLKYREKKFEYLCKNEEETNKYQKNLILDLLFQGNFNNEGNSIYLIFKITRLNVKYII